MEALKVKYIDQFNKITEAYIKDEIRPYEKEFCFCGTIGAVKSDSFWVTWNTNIYEQEQYRKMEVALLGTLVGQTVGLKKYDMLGYPYTQEHGCIETRKMIEQHPNFETALFNGMCAALEVLKQIHIERGEIIYAPPQFQKRELCTVA